MKRFQVIIISALATMLLFSCQKEPDTVKVTGVTLNTTTLTLFEGDSQTLTATVSPSNAANKSIVWYSDDASVVSVNDKGLVEAKKIGQTKVYAKSDDGGHIASCSVIVTAKIISVTSVTLDKSSAELVEGESLTLDAIVNPSDASNKNVSWDSSNKAVAAVDADGNVTAKKAGTARITVTTEDGGKTASCTVTVTAKFISVTSVSLDKNTVELIEGESLTLVANVSPSDASNKTVFWESSDEAVVTVDSKDKENAVETARTTVTTDGGGKTTSCTVTAKKAGTARITVTTEDGGHTASCTVTVNKRIISVASVTLDKSTAELLEGETLTLVASVNPTDASNKNVSWESSDESVASVDSNGKVTAKKAGTARITVKTEDGGKTSSCTLTVNARPIAVTSVTLNKTAVELIEGESLTLVAYVNPSDASNKTVFWESSDGSVAIVDSKGKVTAVKTGTARITVTTEDGGKTASCTVTVKTIAVTGVTLSKSTAELVEGETMTLVATVNPSNASNKSVIWESSNKSVATVDAKGKVTALNAGTARITVTTEDGGKTAFCTVTVKSDGQSKGNNDDFNIDNFDW